MKIQVCGGQLAATDTGSGPVILCAHALFCDGTIFSAMASHLPKKYRLIAVDARAHGNSFTPQEDFTMKDLARDLLVVLDELDIEEAVFLGVSMGGMASMHAALLAPERVRGLVLIDTEADVPPWKNWVERWLLAKAAPWFGVRPFTIDMMVRRMFGVTYRCQNPEEMKSWKCSLASLELESLIRAIKAVNDRPSLINEIHKIKAPTVLVYGDEDLYTPVSSGRRIAALIEGARLEILAQTGHLAVVESPQQVAKIVDKFCSNLTAQ